jgi:hypothetical protein
MYRGQAKLACRLEEKTETSTAPERANIRKTVPVPRTRYPVHPHCFLCSHSSLFSCSKNSRTSSSRWCNIPPLSNPKQSDLWWTNRYTYHLKMHCFIFVLTRGPLTETVAKTCRETKEGHVLKRILYSLGCLQCQTYFIDVLTSSFVFNQSIFNMCSNLVPLLTNLFASCSILYFYFDQIPTRCKSLEFIDTLISYLLNLSCCYLLLERVYQGILQSQFEPLVWPPLKNATWNRVQAQIKVGLTLF